MNLPGPGAPGAGRLYRSSFFLHSAYSVFGYSLAFASLVEPIDWFGVGLGLALVASSWAFWSGVEIRLFPEGRRPGPALYCMASAPLLMMAVAAARGNSSWDMPFWLVMPGAFLFIIRRP